MIYLHIYMMYNKHALWRKGFSHGGLLLLLLLLLSGASCMKNATVLYSKIHQYRRSHIVNYFTLRYHLFLSLSLNCPSVYRSDVFIACSSLTIYVPLYIYSLIHSLNFIFVIGILVLLHFSHYRHHHRHLLLLRKHRQTDRPKSAIHPSIS